MVSTLSKPKDKSTETEAAQRDALLLNFLKTPPQPRPKRERGKSVMLKRKKSKKKTPDK